LIFKGVDIVEDLNFFSSFKVPPFKMKRRPEGKDDVIKELQSII